jgi:uncharacterized protein YndB with AHSA1/START domain
MSVTSIHTDDETLTFTLVADFAAPPERVWQLWADRRQLERWWGPPAFPATFDEHDLTPGGDVTYFMTGPDGERFHGWWRVAAVDAPRSLEVVDGFADAKGVPDPTMPTTTMRVSIAEHAGGTRMEIRTVFDSREDMERLVAMQMVDGMREAVGQIDALLAA